MEKYDRDGDGQVAQTELEPGAVLTRFFRIDLNQDQKLNREEWAAHARVFEQAQNVALAVRLGGEGDVTQSHVDWVFRRGLPTVPSPLVYDDVMYMVKDSGIITSLEAATGKVVKQGRARGPGNYYASPVAGDGKVYFSSERGVVTVLRAGGEWEILAARDFGQRIMATPVIHQGDIYLCAPKPPYTVFARNSRPFSPAPTFSGIRFHEASPSVWVRCVEHLPGLPSRRRGGVGAVALPSRGSGRRSGRRVMGLAAADGL